MLNYRLDPTVTQQRNTFFFFDKALSPRQYQQKKKMPRNAGFNVQLLVHYPTVPPIWHVFVFGEALSAVNYQQKQRQTLVLKYPIMQCLHHVAKGRAKHINIDNANST